MVGFPTVSQGKEPSDASSSPLPHTNGTPTPKGTSTPRGLLHQGGPQAETINLSTPQPQRNGDPQQYNATRLINRKEVLQTGGEYLEQVLTIEGDIPKDSVRF